MNVSNVPRGTIFKIYQQTLLKWQRTINLVSNATLDEFWERHIQDSLQIAKYIPKETQSIVDLGSGAGFPGLALCIATELPCLLIESDHKKCEFLREVIRETGANAKVFNSRIESLPPLNTDLIVSRALASLKQLLTYASPHLSAKGICLFHKGAKTKIEIAEAKKNWQFNYEIYPSDISSEGTIIKIWNLNDTDIRNC